MGEEPAVRDIFAYTLHPELVFLFKVYKLVQPQFRTTRVDGFIPGWQAVGKDQLSIQQTREKM